MVLNYLRPNTHKKIIHLDQGKDGACVTFWFHGAAMYNTDLKFTSEQALKAAVEANATDGAMAWQIWKIFAEAYNLSLVTFDSPFDPGAQKAMDLWYALGCSTQFHLKFYADGVVDGKVDKEYERLPTNKPQENVIMKHFMYLIKENGEYFFINSWGKYIEKGMYNKYKVDMELLKNKNLLYRDCFLVA